MMIHSRTQISQQKTFGLYNPLSGHPVGRSLLPDDSQNSYTKIVTTLHCLSHTEALLSSSLPPVSVRVSTRVCLGKVFIHTI